MATNKVDFDGAYFVKDGVTCRNPIIEQGCTFSISFEHECPASEVSLDDAVFYGAISRAFNETGPVAEFDIVSTPGISGSAMVTVGLTPEVTESLIQYADNWKDDFGDLGWYEIRYNLNNTVRRVVSGKVKISRNALNDGN
jgi:hypothetical protein